MDGYEGRGIQCPMLTLRGWEQNRTRKCLCVLGPWCQTDEIIEMERIDYISFEGTPTVHDTVGERGD